MNYDDVKWQDLSAGTLPAIPEKGNFRLPNGCTGYWETTEQGRCYISDEIGGGVKVWHTALVDQSTLLAIITQENALLKLESVKKEREDKKMVQTLKEHGGKCPYCSFDPSSYTDYCDYHRPPGRFSDNLDTFEFEDEAALAAQKRFDGRQV
jgi:hypothetical protein